VEKLLFDIAVLSENPMHESIREQSTRERIKKRRKDLGIV